MSRISYIPDIAEWENDFSYYYPVKVRFADIDMYGHLNNTVVFTYFQEARIDYLSKVGLTEKWFKENADLIIVAADLQCDYLKQVYFNEDLKIYVKVHEMGRSSMDLHYMGKNAKGEICFVGRGTLVQISKSTGKAVPWSDDVKNMFTGKKTAPVHN